MQMTRKLNRKIRIGQLINRFILAYTFRSFATDADKRIDAIIVVGTAVLVVWLIAAV